MHADAVTTIEYNIQLSQITMGTALAKDMKQLPEPQNLSGDQGKLPSDVGVDVSKV